MNSNVILAIESSCDDTAAAVMIDGTLASNLIANQTVHKKYGGVVPELASREHHQKIVPVVETALSEAGVSKEDISAIAFTQGPGLLGSLLVGCSFAKGLALSLDIPLIAVNHMEAHVLAHFVDDPQPQFPFLCLTVSGGHTQLVRMDNIHDLTVIGETIDDAAGEAFDKIGKYLGLDYPAGPIIDKKAREGKPKFNFSKPRISNHDFSFSGFKTSVLYFLKKEIKKNPNFIAENLNDLCASVQESIVNILMDKLLAAATKEKIDQIGIAGGVSANSRLREVLLENAAKYNWTAHIPNFKYCTDNAAMIAKAGHIKWKKAIFSDQTITPQPRLAMKKRS